MTLKPRLCVRQKKSTKKKRKEKLRWLFHILIGNNHLFMPSSLRSFVLGGHIELKVPEDLMCSSVEYKQDI